MSENTDYGILYFVANIKVLTEVNMYEFLSLFNQFYLQENAK